MKREKAIKKFSRARKYRLIHGERASGLPGRTETLRRKRKN